MPMQLLTGIMEKSGLEGVFLNPVKEPLKKKNYRPLHGLRAVFYSCEKQIKNMQ